MGKREFWERPPFHSLLFFFNDPRSDAAFTRAHIQERYLFLFSPFLPAAKTTGQGMLDVVLPLVVGVRETILAFPCAFKKGAF